VQNLFHSVQLNVNNPHFLIMQGRITKVLNMKPPEILGMLEEAAGTRMYENKKDGALKTLEKKQSKVDEIDKVLSEEILPALEKLRKERGEYQKWAAATQNLERLRRFVIAWEFTQALEVQAGAAGSSEELADRVDELKAAAVELAGAMDEKDEEMKAISAEKEARMGGEIKVLSEEVDELSKDLVRETSGWTNKKEAHAGEAKEVKSVEKQIADLDKSTAKKLKETESLEASVGAERARVEELGTAAARAERELEGIRLGRGTGEDALADKSLSERLAEAKSTAAAAEAEAKAAALTTSHAEKELKEQRKELGQMEKDAKAIEKELAGGQAAVDEVTAKVAKLGFDPAACAAAEATRDAEKAAVRECQEQVDVLSSQLAGLDFRYSDPEKNFDRNRVKGVVAKLVRLQDPAATTALEVVAGGKLYQVVVDTDATAKAVLNKGNLRQRVTIIPLNKINARPLNDGQKAAAHRAGGKDARPAIELVGYAPELKTAMDYAFGGAFVCKDSATAKRVAFDKGVLANCVTLEGDLFNPSGLLTGGSRASGNSTLARLHALMGAEAELEEHVKALKQAEAALAKLAGGAREHQKLVAELEVRKHKVELARTKASQSASGQLAAAVAALEERLAAAKAASDSAVASKKEAEAEAKRLGKEVADMGKDRDKKIKAAEKAAKDAKAEVTKAKEALKGSELKIQSIATERAAVEEERKSLEESRAAALESAAAAEAEAAALEARVAEKRAKYEEAAGRLEERRARLKECDMQVAALAKDKAKLAKKASDGEVELKKLEHKKARLEKDQGDAARAVEQLAKEYPWIDSEKGFFGRAGGDYDFEARDPVAASKELRAAEEVQDKLGKKVNRKVMSMFDKAEQEYQALTSKKRIVENDKTKIEDVISELDEKKREALRATWAKVTKDFGSIFSTLLPGTTAKLEAPEGMEVYEGLEVKVAFGGVWKQSLTELSGGQRSLLALSLILALLLFKPAPLYILDEVDAALDLSHTQNIGRMIKQHFPHSQFVVVSLKEGMFNNANVIFRTKFVDGISQVTRTVPALAERNASAAEDGSARAGKAGRGKKAMKENVMA